jgi:ferredoxin
VQVDPVPPEVEDRCREAVEACPANAINIIEE